MKQKITNLLDRMFSSMTSFGASQTCSRDLGHMRAFLDSASCYQPDDQFHITRIPVRFQ